MTVLKILRFIRWVAIAATAILAIGIAFFEFGPGKQVSERFTADEVAGSSSGDAVSVPAGVPIGGPFKLTDDRGRAVTDTDYRGRWMLVFFGYTNCPDECPLTLQKMATALGSLGSLADRVAPIFITVDPVRDTAARLATYIQSFDARIVGLTGSDDQIAAVAKAYRVYYSPGENEQSGTDMVSHSSFLYLMNPEGKLAALFSQDITVEKLTTALRGRLTASAQSAASDWRQEIRARMGGGMGGMMWGMGLLWLVILVVLLLVIVALVKYIFFK